jgi:hypothetical protein
MGYSISNGERVPYSVGSEKVNYSIGNGTVAHEIVYTATAPTMPIYSVSSSAMPYSFTVGGISKYTMESATENAPVALGSQKIMTVKVLGKGLKTPAWEEQPAEPIAVPEVPVANETENMTAVAAEPIAVPEVPVANETENVTAVAAEPIAVPEVPVANETENVTAVAAEPVVAPAPVLLGIKGMIKDENETALAGWKVDLATSANTPIANTTSSEDGTYSFGNLTAGNYMVSEVIPDGWTAISPADGVASVSLTDMEVTQDFINQKTA